MLNRGLARQTPHLGNFSKVLQPSPSAAMINLFKHVASDSMRILLITPAIHFKDPESLRGPMQMGKKNPARETALSGSPHPGARIHRDFGSAVGALMLHRCHNTKNRVQHMLDAHTHAAKVFLI